MGRGRGRGREVGVLGGSREDGSRYVYPCVRVHYFTKEFAVCLSFILIL